MSGYFNSFISVHNKLSALDSVCSIFNSLMHLQMIESSAHGDEYDGVIFSQLVWLR